MSRKKWSAAEKFKIALIAHQGNQTIEEICRTYRVAASQVHAWKKQLISAGSSAFSKPKENVKEAAMEKEISSLYEKIGQLTMERDFLKKVWLNVQGKKKSE